MTFPRFEIIQSEKDNKFYWNLYPRIGKRHGPILRSIRGYKTKQNAQKSICQVKNIVSSINSKKRKDKKYTIDSKIIVENANIENGGKFFILSGRKETTKLGISKVYTSGLKSVAAWQVIENGVNTGINSVLKIVENSPIE